ncbi:MAG: DUF1667 domain-containing protein [Sarcina ventriculi]|uniref:Uncharacterized protein with conserved CXXC pairs n=2 Tax=Sarcina ventriculi TaxID=1267 RepID=A0ABM9US85_SARVE|nr:DUF1667 domain-containing protein [Sarcina ventriculi]MDO4401570.1 DUF1667 domain-containing protein [Clostridiaceae bacterium]MBU5323341.1 DUF1667 domain-containing protein [Sarcina ventriculi]MCI5635883.1 DUF1667 domain-containing protein [Sarcina ventriculi]MDD7374261.1 DUF1667 domain-containing protein [Sarcina ventriculi]MDY7061509.1 DUF1667 domain-containing protein [Sarcina ventriculi]
MEDELFTSVVRLRGSKFHVVPVKSSKPVPHNKWIEFSKILSRLYVGVPTKIGSVVCRNILNTGIDIICTKNIDE